MIAWNLTGQNLSIFLNGRSHTVPRENRHFGDIMEALEAGDEVTVLHYLDAKRQITVETEGRISFDGHRLMFGDEEIHNGIVDRLHHLWSNGLPYNSLLRLMDRLMENPSRRAVNELYGFLEACELPITNDGCFLAYKRVRPDFTDIHSGKFDNSVGAKPRIRRNEVDEDPTRTCSHGLHVCSAGYLPHFGSFCGTHERDRVVVCKVDPADVVSVPIDYDNSKMRVCAYEVVDDVTDQFFNDETMLPSFHTDRFGGDEDEDFDDPDWTDDDYFDSLDDGFDDAFDDEDEDEPEVPTGPSTHATTSKLDAGQVREIKDYLASGTPIVRIAEVFNVNESTIRKIKTGETWGWVR